MGVVTIRANQVFVAVGIPFLLSALLFASGCARVENQGNVSAPSSSKPSEEQRRVAELTAVATDTPCVGPSIQNLIRVEDFEGILGRDDLVFAAAT